MHGYRTEVAFAVTAAVSRQGKLDSIQGSDFTLSHINRMDVIYKSKLIDSVELVCGGIIRGGIMNQAAVVSSPDTALSR